MAKRKAGKNRKIEIDLRLIERIRD